MKGWTVDEIAAAVAFAASFLSGVGFLQNKFKKWLNGSLNENFANLDNRIQEITKRVDRVDIDLTKNILVTWISLINDGHRMNEFEASRFWEQYEYYRAAGGNSYIKEAIERMRKEGKL